MFTDSIKLSLRFNICCTFFKDDFLQYFHTQSGSVGLVSTSKGLDSNAAVFLTMPACFID